VFLSRFLFDSNNYKLYSIDKLGNITNISDVNVSSDENRASINLEKTENGYKIAQLNFYYDKFVNKSISWLLRAESKLINKETSINARE